MSDYNKKYSVVGNVFSFILTLQTPTEMVLTFSNIYETTAVTCELWWTISREIQNNYYSNDTFVYVVSIVYCE